MRVIAKSRLRHYWTLKPYKIAEEPLKAWHEAVTLAAWKTFNDVRSDFPKASIEGNGHVVFNICGGTFRLIVKIEFRMNAVFIRFFGTHREYDTVRASEV